jgi:hypothetical protein
LSLPFPPKLPLPGNYAQPRLIAQWTSASRLPGADRGIRLVTVPATAVRANGYAM